MVLKSTPRERRVAWPYQSPALAAAAPSSAEADPDNEQDVSLVHLPSIFSKPSSTQMMLPIHGFVISFSVLP